MAMACVVEPGLLGDPGALQRSLPALRHIVEVEHRADRAGEDEALPVVPLAVPNHVLRLLPPVTLQRLMGALRHGHRALRALGLRLGFDDDVVPSTVALQGAV